MNKNFEQHFLNEVVKLPATVKDGFAAWQSPSNIAIVKYWGKHGKQLPHNPSISLTLKNARSETKIAYKKAGNEGFKIDFYFDGQANPQFGQKLSNFVRSVLPFFPFLEGLHLHIESSNTFPHSSGIASSASSMSALVMCILDIEKQISGKNTHQDEYLQKASYFSRLASGSASRSLFPIASLWGKTEGIDESSDEIAIPLAAKVHDVFKSYRDSILIISAETKSVSSRAGHSLMENNPYAAARYNEATKNTLELMQAMKAGDLDVFVRIAEAEALQLHALMMSSQPSFILLKPNTLAAIAAIRDFRETTKIPLCFTLDAGPNLHLLYPQSYQQQVKTFIEFDLIKFCHNNYWIDDQVGTGPSAII